MRYLLSIMRSNFEQLESYGWGEITCEFGCRCLFLIRIDETDGPGKVI